MWALAALVVLIIIAVLAFLSYRAMRQQQVARTLAIHSPRGIDEAMFVNIGGIDQWVHIRGEDRDNPVILVLHGGMAMSYMAFTPAFQPWEKSFTVVQWDRRGVGKTFGRNGAKGSGEVTLDRSIDDGVELADYLRRHLRKDKIILLGHSMGSQIGISMAARRPDLFYAYVGTEQIVDMKRNEAMSYQVILDRLRAAHRDKAVARLQRLGPPPYRTAMDWGVKQSLGEIADPTYGDAMKNRMGPMLRYSPDYTLGDLFNFVAANPFMASKLFPQWMAFDAHKLGTRFGTPIFMIQGEADVLTPTPLVVEWLNTVEAPQKAWLPIHAGHLALMVASDQFLHELVTHVRPLAMPQAAPRPQLTKAAG